MVTKCKKHKINFFNEYSKENNILLMNFTETWLNDYIEKDIKIDGYQLYRGDRKNKGGGGVAIYIKNEYDAEKIGEMSVGGVEMTAIFIKRINTINIVIYRPPDAATNDFLSVLENVDEIVSRVNRPEPTVLITGDFNFPFIRWVRGSNYGCRWEHKKNSGATTEGRKQLGKLNEVVDRFGLVQIVDEATRGNNTLDLIFTNDVSRFANIEVTSSSMSDHNQIELTTNLTTRNDEATRISKKEYGDEINFWHLNFHHEDVRWTQINEEISEIQWKYLFHGRDTETCTNMLMMILKMLCLKLIPVKKQRNKNKIPRERKKLYNRMKMLKRSKHRAKGRKKERELEMRIQKTEIEILNHREQERKVKENKVIENMKKKPKVFFDYIKNQENRETKIGPFKIQDRYIYNANEICELLVKQYNSQFSNNTNKSGLNEDIFSDIQEGDLADIKIIEKDIIDAIGGLKNNSAAGPDGIPAKFLINTKNAIATPLTVIMRKSLDEGKIPDIFKLAYVTPIHKGGSKLKPEQYRPVSLTSHIMKVFERVVKCNIMEHLVQEQLISPGQHGFVPGRSTQTQLLQHYCDVYDALAEGVRIDTVYLDFAKAFDKVDHSILLQKVAKHKIKGKVGLWIKEFLSNRKYKVVANGEMSEMQDVLSGVPQGTVLAAILFIMMIANIDEEVERSIVRCFADDTRSSIKIKTEEDKKALQKDLESIYKWAKENLMEFNENKFEQMSHGETIGVEVEPYKTPSENDITPSSKVKDLGVVGSDDLLFREHIDGLVTSSKIMQGMLLRTFATRQEIPMMTMYNTYIRSKLEYCSLVWSPSQQKYINKLERVQKNFTSKIEGIEHLNYHKKLKKLKLYSLERRRERYMIINAWQQIEGITENVLGLKARRMGRSRRIISTKIPLGVNGKRIKERDRTLIHNSTAKKMERIFNALPQDIRNLTGVETDNFKRLLDKWLLNVPDTPRIDDYGVTVAAESNSIFHQARYVKK